LQYITARKRPKMDWARSGWQAFRSPERSYFLFVRGAYLPTKPGNLRSNRILYQSAKGLLRKRPARSKNCHSEQGEESYRTTAKILRTRRVLRKKGSGWQVFRKLQRSFAKKAQDDKNSGNCKDPS